MIQIPIELDFRPVLRIDKKSLMGSGRAELLKKILDTGSLTLAAKSMGMSYRHAWGIIHHMEEILGKKLVQSKRGGKKYGETNLTDAGKQLLIEFESKSATLGEAVEKTFKKPSLTTDGILVMNKRILLVKRMHEPFKGMFALPGGFIEYGERLENCVVREVKEETGLLTSIKSLLGIYSDPNRDPRGHTVSAVYILSYESGRISDSDETHAEWVPLNRIPNLAFDHDKILTDYHNRQKKSK